MTVSSVDLGSVCASLMDISLQLLASVKSLERSLNQVGSNNQGIFGLMITFILCRNNNQNHQQELKVPCEIVNKC